MARRQMRHIEELYASPPFRSSVARGEIGDALVSFYLMERLFDRIAALTARRDDIALYWGCTIAV
ncbi:MAG TPA: hypothetical protein VKF36_18310 [Syntrophorhabdales bacterium]|nr:hypothetical protein [Syntrophorhabdales bacterium]